MKRRSNLYNQVMVKCFKRNNQKGYSFFWGVYPPDEYHAEYLIFTQRFSIGLFWSPYHTIIESIFRKLPINTEYSISYKCSVSIS